MSKTPYETLVAIADQAYRIGLPAIFHQTLDPDPFECAQAARLFMLGLPAEPDGPPFEIGHGVTGRAVAVAGFHGQALLGNFQYRLKDLYMLTETQARTLAHHAHGRFDQIAATRAEHGRALGGILTTVLPMNIGILARIFDTIGISLDHRSMLTEPYPYLVLFVRLYAEGEPA